MKEAIVILVCLALNALIAAFEMAFVSVRKTELRKLSQNGNRHADKLLALKKNPERPLSVIQIGINLVGAFSAAVGGAGAEEKLSPWLEHTLHMSEGGAEALSVFLVVLPLTYLTVVLGELVPKTLALRNPTPIALSGSLWIQVADYVLSPLVSMLEFSTRQIIKLAPKRKIHSESVIDDALIDIEDISNESRQYVRNIIGVEDKRASDVLIPWSTVEFITTEDTHEEIVRKIIQSGHTRLPVLEGPQVVGLINTKEFISLYLAKEEEWSQILRPILKIQAGDYILGVLHQMQEKRSHIAVTYDGKRDVLGIVTLEDIMEEVVGEIRDEDDDGFYRKVFLKREKLPLSR